MATPEPVSLKTRVEPEAKPVKLQLAMPAIAEPSYHYWHGSIADQLLKYNDLNAFCWWYPAGTENYVKTLLLKQILTPNSSGESPVIHSLKATVNGASTVERTETSEADWEAGTLDDGCDTTSSPGDLQVGGEAGTVFTDDFENSDLNAYCGKTSALSISTTNPYAGSKCLAVDGIHSNTAWGHTFDSAIASPKLKGHINQTEDAGTQWIGLFTDYDCAGNELINQYKGYLLKFDAANGQITLGKTAGNGGAPTWLTTKNVTLAFNTWYEFELSVQDGVVTLTLGGQTITANDDTYTSFNSFVGYCYRSALFDDLEVDDLDSATSATRISPAWDISAAYPYTGGSIEMAADIPDGATAQIQSSLDGGVTWNDVTLAAVYSGDIPGLT